MIIGTSSANQELLHSVDQLASANTPVVISGESGVGKELVARALHGRGARSKGPFVAVNIAAIPASLFEAELFGHERGAFTGAIYARIGAFEAAHNGSLFLDEIGELPASMQAKLLRVLETGEVQPIGANDCKRIDFRLLTATNQDLEALVRSGLFRADLYYRICVHPIHVPPLRERCDDIPAIAAHHLSMIAIRDRRPTLHLTAAALDKLMTYGWPGNVRELRNLLERAVVLADDGAIEAKHVVFSQNPARRRIASGSLAPYREAKARFELEYYTQLMRQAGGNVTLAAKLSHKTRKEIYDALKRLDLDATDYRANDQRDE
jgi:transcriptional regulator with GAF, ATPase, and Fis domain